MSRKILALAVAAAVLVPVLIVGLGAQVKDAPPAEKLQAADDPFAVPVPAGKKAKAENPSAPSKPTNTPAVTAGERQSLRSGEKAILKALEEPAKFDFEDTRLCDVAEYLQEQYRVPVVLDKNALDEAGTTIDALVKCQLSGTSLRSALDLMLTRMKLTWTIRSDALLITTPDVEEKNLIVRVYDVSDLIVPKHDYPYRSKSLPTASAEHPFDKSVPGSPWGTGGSGTGMFNIMKGGAIAASYSDLIDLLTGTIGPSTWDSAGGPGTIHEHDNLLAIAQTLSVHWKIEALLAELRAKKLASPTLLVELQWLWLDAKQHEQLVGGEKRAAGGNRSLTVDAKALEQLARAVPGFRGQIACSNAQWVHLASGDRRSVISSTIPVMDRSVGYQPVIQVPNVGIVVELRPSMAPGATTAMLDVQSTVTRWAKPQPPLVHVGASWPPHLATEGGGAPPPASADQPGQPAPTRYMAPQEITKEPGGSASSPIERPQMPAQQLATTLRVPLGKPVIVGAMTFAPEGDAGLDKAAENPRQLYVIATTSVVSEP